jgi:hypothetical protein
MEKAVAINLIQLVIASLIFGINPEQEKLSKAAARIPHEQLVYAQEHATPLPAVHAFRNPGPGTEPLEGVYR